MIMMNYEMFEEQVIESVQKVFPGNEIRKKETAKNNIMQKGIMIMIPDSNVALTIYLDEPYKNYCKGCKFDEVVKEVLDTAKNMDLEKPKEIDISYFDDFENVRDQIFPMLVGTKDNDDYLECVVHTKVCDMAAIYYISMNDPDLGESTVDISPQLLQHWKGISLEKLHETAMENLRKEEVLLLKWDDFLGGPEIIDLQNFMPVKTHSDIRPMWLLSNKQLKKGAGHLLDHELMDLLEEKIGAFYIIPSSIHECMLMSKELTSAEELLEVHLDLVSTFPLQIRLSENIYEYENHTFAQAKIV